GTGGLDHGGVENVRVWTAGEILFADTTGAATARKRSRQLGQAFERHFAGYQTKRGVSVARRETEVGYATGALAFHDSPAAAVIVSLGASGPGIGRRIARSPRPKNRRIRRARDDARRGTPPRAARPGRYRADQREMPRRATCKLDSGFRSG